MRGEHPFDPKLVPRVGFGIRMENGRRFVNDSGIVTPDKMREIVVLRQAFCRVPLRSRPPVFAAARRCQTGQPLLGKLVQQAAYQPSGNGINGQAIPLSFAALGS